MNSLKAKVFNVIRRYRMILPGEKIILGVSGGPDSMALLYLMYDLHRELECSLHIAHLDHRLRGKESSADAEYVKEHARKLDLPITVESLDVRDMMMPGESLESCARRIRYDFYERVISEVRADKVAQGHNADDQAETVLMRFLRGSGALGLSGIPPVRDGKYIRPLIEVSRSEIMEYLHSIQIEPRLDISNLSADYIRNKIRLELIPLLEREYSPNIRQILQQTGDILRTENKLLTALAQTALEKCTEHKDSKSITINIPVFTEYHTAIQRRALRSGIKDLLGDLQNFDFDHIKDLLELAISGVTGSTISLPRAISVEKTYDKLTIRLSHQSKAKAEPFNYPIKVPGETIIPELGISIETIISSALKAEYELSDEQKLKEIFDYDKIHGKLRLRSRQKGDRFQPLGMAGTKKLKDFFIDEKVPRHMRDRIPILTNGNNIIWIVGYRISEMFKITANTKTQLVVSVDYKDGGI